MTDNSAFYYVDGDPTKGVWVDLDSTTDGADVLAALAKAKLIPLDADGEPNYGGDLLVADTEGDLAGCFLGSHGTFDLMQFCHVADFCERNFHIDEQAVAAWLNNMGIAVWDADEFQDAYQGRYDSEVAFAEALVDDSGMLADVPESLQGYFDYKKFARGGR